MISKELFELSCKVSTGVIPCNVNEKTDTQWALVKGERNVLVFPYTVSKLDWLQNFDFFKIPYKGMRRKWFAHRGFLNKYKSVRDDILESVQGLDNLIVTGFSQGGALATLALEDILFNYPNITVYGASFGAPRSVGWLAPQKRWHNLIRYEVNGDPVTMLPPFIFGYKHVGHTVLLGAKRVIPLIKYHTENYSKELK